MDIFNLTAVEGQTIEDNVAWPVMNKQLSADDDRRSFTAWVQLPSKNPLSGRSPLSVSLPPSFGALLSYLQPRSKHQDLHRSEHAAESPSRYNGRDAKGATANPRSASEHLASARGQDRKGDRQRSQADDLFCETCPQRGERIATEKDHRDRCAAERNIAMAVPTLWSTKITNTLSSLPRKTAEPLLVAATART
jgi:hypothetical protein